VTRSLRIRERALSARATRDAEIERGRREKTERFRNLARAHAAEVLELASDDVVLRKRNQGDQLWSFDADGMLFHVKFQGETPKLYVEGLHDEEHYHITGLELLGRHIEKGRVLGA